MTRSRIAIRRLNAEGEPEGEWINFGNVVDLNWEQLDELAISNPADLEITQEERVTGIIESRPGNMTFTLEGPPAKILLALFEGLKSQGVVGLVRGRSRDYLMDYLLCPICNVGFLTIKGYVHCL